MSGGKAGRGLFVAMVLFLGYLFYTRRLEAFSAILRYGPGGPPETTGPDAGMAAARAMRGILAPYPIGPALRPVPRDPGISVPTGGVLDTDITGPNGSVHVRVRKGASCYAEVAAAGLEVGLSVQETSLLADDLCRR